jgi:cell division protein FtsW
MKNRSIDAWLILTSTLLIVFGLIMVYSASAFSALELVGDEAYYLIRQLIALSVGLVLCVATAVTPMRIIRRYRVVLYSAVLCGLVLCFVPGVRHTANGASRWIGAGGIHWQPSEFAKIIVLIMMADYLDRFRGQMADSRVVLRTILIPLPALLLIFPQPDFGTTAIIAGLCCIMVFIAGLRTTHTFVAAAAGLGIGIPAMIMEPYRVQRLTSFMDPWKTANAEGRHALGWFLGTRAGQLHGQATLPSRTMDRLYWCGHCRRAGFVCHLRHYRPVPNFHMAWSTHCSKCKRLLQYASCRNTDPHGWVRSIFQPWSGHGIAAP